MLVPTNTEMIRYYGKYRRIVVEKLPNMLDRSIEIVLSKRSCELKVVDELQPQDSMQIEEEKELPLQQKLDKMSNDYKKTLDTDD